MDHDCEGTPRHPMLPIDLVQQGSRSSEAEVLFEHLPNRRSRSLSYHCFRVHMNRIPGQLSAPADVDVLAEAHPIIEAAEMLKGPPPETQTAAGREGKEPESVRQPISLRVLNSRHPTRIEALVVEPTRHNVVSLEGSEHCV